MNIKGITRDELQRRKLTLPKGDLLLSDGRKLREIIGYKEYMMNLSLVDKVTKKAFVQMRGWQHIASNLVVSASVNITDKWGELLHVSLSYADHDPTWEEIKMVRQVFFPADLDAMMVLPRVGNYVNVHKHCFQMYQIPQEWDIG